MDKRQTPSRHIQSGGRSKSNLGEKDTNITGGPNNLNGNVTMERNGSMPNINMIGNRMPQLEKTKQLRFAYDKYLSSVEAKYALQTIEKKISSNIIEQKKVFLEEFETLKNQLVTLSEELKLINDLKTEKNDLVKKIEVLEKINKAIVFNDSDEETMSLLSTTAYKVIVKNFKKLDETDLNSVRILLREIIEPLKMIDYENKINVRVQLKDLLIKVAMLTKGLDEYKSKCEEIFNKHEDIQNYNSSLKILKAQFGKNPDPTLLPTPRDLVGDLQKLLDKAFE